MPTREFSDSKGVLWRAWDVTPDVLHPATRSEDYMEPWAGGWLTFECDSEKRRLLAPYPSRWFEFDLDQLEELCNKAERVDAVRVSTPRVVAPPRVDANASGRTFATPRGRLWTVKLHAVPGAHGGSESVLRFTSGDSVVDLRDWPANWQSMSRDDYALLILDAEPPRRIDATERLQRRRDDRPTA